MAAKTRLSQTELPQPAGPERTSHDASKRSAGSSRRKSMKVKTNVKAGGSCFSGCGLGITAVVIVDLNLGGKRHGGC